MFRARQVLVFAALLALLAGPSFAQKEQIKKLMPTVKGSTGLFNTYLADTLRQGEFMVGTGVHKFHRDPGDLDFTIFPLSFTVGLHDRIEFFASYEIQRRVNADQIAVNRIGPNDPLTPTTIPGGAVSFFNETPFMDVGFGDGTGDIWLGLKFNLLSEKRGAAIGLALQPIVKTHLTDDREHLARGLTAGSFDGGGLLILSKDFGPGGSFTAHGGPMFAGDFARADRQNWIDWGLGVTFPFGRGSPVYFVGELVGNGFFGDKQYALANPRSPMDAYAGLRIYGANWMSVSGGYNYHFNTIDDALGIDATDQHGYIVQLGLGRKINRPPTAECSVVESTVTEGTDARFNVIASDEDDDNLAITWTSSGGRLSEQGTSATLDTSGLGPGRADQTSRYEVKAEVSDGDKVASCSVDVSVRKDARPPTISCAPASSEVTEGDSVTLRATASDPNNDALTYSWAVDGSSVSNDQAQFEFGTTGRQWDRDYTVRVTVSDVDNMTASCEFDVRVNRKPNRGPSVTLRLDKSEVFAGETVQATAQCSDPDNDPLTYSWTVDGQRRSGSGSTLSINTGGMSGGSHSVSVTCNDDRGGSADDTASFRVTEKIIIPTDRIQPDNQAKAQLDEIALKMQQNPQLRARITGHTDDRGSEEANQRVGQRRADAAKDYLVKQHNLDENRIEASSAGEGQPMADNSTAEGRQQNRRVEVELFVP